MQRQGIYKEGSSSVSRDKRSLERGEDEQPERKRPALASVIVEALKVDSLQKLCSSLEPILRRVVSEEVERALAKLGPAKLNGRSSPKMLECLDVSLQLHFRTRLSLPLFTGGKVEGDQGALIHVVLVDANTGKVVATGPEASAKLDVVVLEGDFNNEDDEEWTQEEFESHVVKEREGKRPLLTGDLQVNLKEGVGTLGELTFTDNSSWIRSRKFRLGLRIASGFCDGIRIREAKTEAFTVKDHRGELYKKHYPPSLNDEVWRLEKIGKDGAFHKKLNSANIFTVEDFLRLVVRDPQKLRNILGSGMSNKMWDALVEHAKTCVLSGKYYYVYHPEDARNIGVVFNNIYELAGLIVGEQYHSADSLSDSQKDYVDSLVKKAYENWDRVIEYDGKSLLAFEQNKRSTVPQNDLPLEAIDYSNMDNQLAARGQAVMSSDQHISSGLTVEGYNDNRAPRYPVQSQMMISNSRGQYDNTANVSNDHLLGNSHQNFSTRNNNNTVGLALATPQASTSGFQTLNSSIQQSTLSLSPFDDWSHSRNKGGDEFFNEDEIRLRSHEMLENEDMQHLLRLFSMGGHSSINVSEDSYSLPSFMPSPMPSFDEDRSRPGKAVVGWLKIKAAMRWGFFIRKKAAEKRAQLVELEDE